MGKTGPADRGQKPERVKEVFTGIAGDYDRVNKVISWGQIGRWRERLVEAMDLDQGERVLEVGCGTGRLTRLMAERSGAGEILGVDVTPEMLEKAKRDLKDEYGSRVRFAVGRGESLDSPDNYFDLAVSAFTLRNVEDIGSVLSEMRRVVRPGGRVLNLELAKPGNPIFRRLYFLYFDGVLPVLAGLIHGDIAPYRYLTESLKSFPHQEELKGMARDAGLVEVSYEELFGGVAAIHSGKKREK